MKVTSPANDFFLDPFGVPYSCEFHKNNRRGSTITHHHTLCNKFATSEPKVVFDDSDVLSEFEPGKAGNDSLGVK